MDLSSVSGQVIYQTLGIIGFVLTVISFQFKKFRTVLVLQGIGCVMFAIQYLLGQAYSGFFLNLIGICRSIGFGFIEDKKKRKGLVFILIVTYVIASALSIILFDEQIITGVITGIASSIGTAFICLGDPKKYRIAQLSIISPGWLFYSIWYLSIGGIITEVLNMVSVIVYFVRQKIKTNKEIKNISQSQENVEN